MTMLEERLSALGDALDLDVDESLGDAVRARLDETPPRVGLPVLRIAAVLVLVVAVVAVAIPSSRRTVADWFGFDGVRIERRPDAPTASAPDPFDRDTTSDVSPATEPADPADQPDETVASPSIGTVVEVDGTDILLSEFVGTLDNPAIGKTVGDGTDVRQVAVGGEVGIWIDGAPHDVSFFDEQGDIVFERFAGNTLLWQDGEVVRRLEGFADVATAIEYAEQFDP